MRGCIERVYNVSVKMTLEQRQTGTSIQKEIETKQVEELDPFGAIPIDAELIKGKINAFRQSFLADLPESGWGLSKAQPEGHISIDTIHYDQHRYLPLRVQIIDNQQLPRIKGINKELIHRFQIYENGVAIVKLVEKSYVYSTHGKEKKTWKTYENILSQRFADESYLRYLDYAQKVITAPNPPKAHQR